MPSHFNPKSFYPRRNFLQQRFSIAEAAFLFMMAYLASRGLGVARQVIFNALFGASPQANAYYAAARLPDTLFNLVAGGALAHAFIPVFVSFAKDHDQRETDRLFSLIINIMLVLLIIFIIVCEFLTPAFVNNVLVPGYSQSERVLTTTLTRIMLLQPLILGLSTIASAILNSKRQFLWSALSIVVYNFGLIGGLLLSLAFPGVGIYGPTFGVLAAASIHMTVLVAGLVKQKIRYTFFWELKHSGLREITRLLIPNILTTLITSIGPIVDIYFVSFFPDHVTLSALNNASMLFQLPLALVAQSVAYAALPWMSAQAAAGRYVHMRQTALRIASSTILLSVPFALLLGMFGKPLIHLLFQHGTFTRHATDLTALALIGFALGLPGKTAVESFARAFYALKDARTPFITGIFSLIIQVSFVVILMKVFSGGFLILAIPVATTVAATAEAMLLCLLLLVRLHSRVKTDRGWKRLQQRRKYAVHEVLKDNY